MSADKPLEEYVKEIEAQLNALNLIISDPDVRREYESRIQREANERRAKEVGWLDEQRKKIEHVDAAADLQERVHNMAKQMGIDPEDFKRRVQSGEIEKIRQEMEYKKKEEEFNRRYNAFKETYIPKLKDILPSLEMALNRLINEEVMVDLKVTSFDTIRSFFNARIKKKVSLTKLDEVTGFSNWYGGNTRVAWEVGFAPNDDGYTIVNFDELAIKHTTYLYMKSFFGSLSFILDKFLEPEQDYSFFNLSNYRDIHGRILEKDDRRQFGCHNYKDGLKYIEKVLDRSLFAEIKMIMDKFYELDKFYG